MKKFLIVFLAIIAVAAIAVSAFVFVPKVVNESQVNKLSSGGIQDGTTTFILSDAFEGSAKVENEKMEFCFTTVRYANFNDIPTSFVKEKEHLYLIGEYSVGSDKNITIDVEECYNILELVGTEENIENYKQIYTKMYQDYLSRRLYTQQQYDREIAIINGKKTYPINEKATITTAKLRMDTETGKTYLISYGSQYSTVEFSYHENGAIKSETVKIMGVIPEHVQEYDTKGNKLKDGSEREFYDDGVIKRESVYRGYSNHIYEYDTEGRLVKYSRRDDGAPVDMFKYTYEYNSDGICFFIKYESLGSFSETQILAFGHERETMWDEYSEHKRTEERFDGEIIKETSH